MSILLTTTLGRLVIDLDVSNAPLLCENILKLVKLRYYDKVRPGLAPPQLIEDQYVTSTCSILGHTERGI